MQLTQYCKENRTPKLLAGNMNIFTDMTTTGYKVY